MPGRVRDTVHHPLFARLFTRLSAAAEERGQAEHRRENLAGLSGRVIEVGAGHGLNFKAYPGSVREVLAVEPEGYLRSLAEEAAKQAPVKIRVVDGVADRLPADSDSFDAAVASLVMCSVPDQDAAFAEVGRVLRPGGELRFYEHVVSERARLARMQRALDRLGIWPLVAGGCHASRDTRAAIERSGLEIESCRSFRFRRGLPELITAPKILGVARRGQPRRSGRDEAPRRQSTPAPSSSSEAATISAMQL